MTDTPIIARSIAELRTVTRQWRREGKSVSLVPTMGALHEGHMTLVRRARSLTDRVVVSIFVNPAQFAPNEDFSSYPRREAEDVLALQHLEVPLVWAPGSEVMYPVGFETRVVVGSLSEVLCGPQRPGHFEGVTTVVTKLLLQVQPDIVVFGEKDFQQLQVIRRMVRDLELPVRIEAVPTVRDEHGLALSSRNAYLDNKGQKVAPNLFRILDLTARAILSGGPIDRLLAKAEQDLRSAGFSSVEYVELADVETLGPARTLDRPARLLAAAWVGKTRLIDNVPVMPESTLTLKASQS